MSRQSVSLSGNLRSKRLLPKRTARECEGYGSEELGLGKKYTIGFSVAFSISPSGLKKEKYLLRRIVKKAEEAPKD